MCNSGKWDIMGQEGDWSADIYHSTGEPQNRDAHPREPVTQDHAVHASVMEDV